VTATSASAPFIYRGGRLPRAGQAPVLCIHGAGHDHSVWAQQARHLARHGYRVLAPDLPGHGRSPGPLRTSVESLAEWVLEVLAAEQAGPATLVGHSLGSLVALEAAARRTGQVAGLVLLGTAVPMPVSAALLEAALTDPDQGHRLINQWSFSAPAQLGNGVQPGFHLPGINRRLMERLAAGVLHTDLAACNGYAGGLEAAAAVRCPTLLVCGGRDRMTPAAALAPLLGALCQVPGGARMISLPTSGHSMLSEAPGDVQAAIRGFLQEKVP
jgi:pimeloyl-ACP methyl ester carboxylesterase